jgi:hypothetical protein
MIEFNGAFFFNRKSNLNLTNDLVFQVSREVFFPSTVCKLQEVAVAVHKSAFSFSPIDSNHFSK